MFKVLAIVMVLLLPLGIGMLAYTMGYQYTQDTGIRMVESLVVKITYHPELARCIGSWGSSREQVGYEVTDVGGFFKIEQFADSGEVKITVGNETAGTFKANELKANVKLLNLTVEGLPLKIEVAICKIPIPYNMSEVPDDIKRDALRLLENYTFTKWLREEGFRYTVKEVSPIGPLILDYTIRGVLVGLRVEDLDISCRLDFDKPYILMVNASIPEELKVSPYEKDNYGIIIICEYLYKSGGYIGFFPHPASRNITRPTRPGDPVSSRRRLNITNEIKEEALRIMRGSRVLAKLLESAGCEIKKIGGWESEQSKRVTVILVCEKIKGYGISVTIDLKAAKIEKVYIHSESLIATIDPVYC